MRYRLFPPGKRGPFWYCRGRLNGKPFEFSCRTADRAAAEARATAKLGEVISGALPTKGQVTFRQAAIAYKAFRKPRPDDVKWIDKLAAWFDRREIGEILHAHLVEAAEEMLPGKKAGTKNRGVIGPAAAVLHYAAEQGWCQYRRFRRFEEDRRSPRKPVSDQAMGMLLKATFGHQRMLLAILYETGLRLSDAMFLTEEDVDLPAGHMLVTIKKTGERLQVNISPDVIAMIASLSRCGRGRLFPWPARWSVYRWLRPLCKTLGITYTPHMSRHALATDLQRRRIPDKEAAEHGAWRDPRSLHRYQHASPAPLAGRRAGALYGENAGKGGKKRR